MDFVERFALREHAELDGIVGTPADVESHPNYETPFVARLRAGDAAAFDHFVAERTNDVYALLLRLTQDAEEARDLTQETFLQAFRYIASFRGESDLRTWLYRIAVNQARNRRRWWRRRKQSDTISLDQPDDTTGEAFSARLACETSETPEACALRNERERHLLRALGSLNNDAREVVVLRDIEGLSYEEVAEALGTNTGTVKSRLSRARAELRRRLSHLE